MPKRYVHTPFTLRHDDGKTQQFGVGEQELEQAVAEHWYVKHHTRAPGDAPKPAAAPVGGAELDAARAELDARAEQLEAARADVLAEADRLSKLRGELDALATKLDIDTAALDTRESAVAKREQEHGARVAEFEAAQKAAGDGSSSKQGGRQQGGKQA